MKPNLATSGWDSVGALLRGELELLADWTAHWNGRRFWLHMGVIIFGAGLYGAAMGCWRDPLQALYTGIKLPLVILLTTLGNGLLNGMLAPLLGLNVTFRQSLAVVLMSFAVTAMVLGALSPVALFIVWNAPPLAVGTTMASPEYALLQLTLAVFVALAGVMGNLRLVPLLREWAGSAAVARNVLLAWLAGNLFSRQPDLLGAAPVHLGGEPPGGIHRAKLLSGQFF
jgi:hypothetical protein